MAIKSETDKFIVYLSNENPACWGGGSANNLEMHLLSLIINYEGYVFWKMKQGIRNQCKL